MTTKKRDKGHVAGERDRPAMKSSHEKVKVARGPRREGAPAARPRGPLQPRPQARPQPRVGGIAPDGRERLRPKRPRASEAPAAAPGTSSASQSARDTAAAVAMAAIDKKAAAVEILDVAEKVDYADFLVIMTGRSDRHTQALAQGIEEALRKKGIRPVAMEGMTQGTWILIDYGDVVVHVFQDEARILYDIEGLWLDASRLPIPAEERSP